MNTVQDILTGLSDLKTAVDNLTTGSLPPGTVAVAQADLDTIAADVSALVSAVQAKSGGTTTPPVTVPPGPVTPPVTPPSTPVGP